jgi:hypothetical protein
MYSRRVHLCLAHVISIPPWLHTGVVRLPMAQPQPETPKVLRF